MEYFLGVGFLGKELNCKVLTISQRTPLIIWVYLSKEDMKVIRYGKVVSRKVGTLADLLPLKIHIMKKEKNGD